MAELTVRMPKHAGKGSEQGEGHEDHDRAADGRSRGGRMRAVRGSRQEGGRGGTDAATCQSHPGSLTPCR